MVAKESAVTEIPKLAEIENVRVPKYSERVFTDEDIDRGTHRSFVGGRWDRLGLHQKEFVLSQGLRPEHKFLDVGCGPFRAGGHIIDVLDPGNYYGIDANRSLLQAGYDVELTDEQRARLPLSNLRANERFNVDFGVRFDMAIAQSVFTHVSLNHIRLCLYRVAKVMKPGAKFFATFFEQPPQTSLDYVYHRVEGGVAYSNEQNVFWYYRSDLEWAASFAPWRFEYIGEWGHPAGQVMAAFTRLTDAEAAPAR